MDDRAAGRQRVHGSRAGSLAHVRAITALPGRQYDPAAQLTGNDDEMTLARRWLDPGPQARHRADLARSVTAARVVVLLTAAAAIVIAAALHVRGRQLEAAVVGLAGVTTAVVADALLRWIGWQVQRSIEADALDRQATRTPPYRPTGGTGSTRGFDRRTARTSPIDHGQATTTRDDDAGNTSGAA